MRDMNFPCPSPILRPVATASLLAATALAFTGCFDMGKKGESGLVVSSVDPAMAAHAGQVDMTVADTAADYSSARVEDYLEPEVDLDLNRDEAPEPSGRTEITPSEVTDSGDFKDYTVEKGDSLWSIGRKFDTSIASLKRANGMTGDNLVAGKTIRIPVVDGKVDATEAPGEATGKSSEVVASVPEEDVVSAKEEMPETLPSGVVPPDPPRRPSLTVIEDDSAPEAPLPAKKAETTIGEDGFLRFDDE
jgi:LysM repeat protein